MITVQVGPEKIPFHFHRGLLCHFSAYFKAVLQSSFKEASQGVIELPDEDVKTFGLFARWIYFNRFQGTDHRDEESDVQSTGSLTLMDVSRLWVFGDMRKIPDLMNAALDTLHHIRVKGTDRFKLAHVQFVYENTVGGSPLRKLVVESFVIFAAFDFWFKEKQRTGLYHEDFLCDLILRLHDGCSCYGSSIDRLKLWGSLDVSQFYVHEKVVLENKSLMPHQDRGE